MAGKASLNRTLNNHRRLNGVSKPLAVKTARTARTFIIPDQKEEHRGRKTLVLDLDETLVHSTLKTLDNPDISFTVRCN